MPDIDGAEEGTSQCRMHLMRERNKKIKIQKKKNAKNLLCEICGFNFEKEYGVRFCEAHHKKPLSKFKKSVETKIIDLAIVCSNCHLILHHKNWGNRLRLLLLLTSQNQALLRESCPQEVTIPNANYSPTAHICAGRPKRKSLAHNVEEALAIVEKICYPVLVGRIFVFWGKGMVVFYKEKYLRKFVEEAVAKAS